MSDRTADVDSIGVINDFRDDKVDQYAITIGYKLAEKYGTNCSVGDFRNTFRKIEIKLKASEPPTGSLID
ncbi:MAG: hypothetical protein SFU25_02635 [Candidatus Caenarcaniphilales bacterium]|nr:hypothetical protein [Candidatus Caenarcaniphilales bacterium]